MLGSPSVGEIWEGGKEMAKWSPKRDEDKFTPMGGGGDDDDDEGVEKTAFQGGGRSHQPAAPESES
jgi:hypothetical protein